MIGKLLENKKGVRFEVVDKVRDYEDLLYGEVLDFYILKDLETSTLKRITASKLVKNYKIFEE